MAMVAAKCTECGAAITTFGEDEEETPTESAAIEYVIE